MSCLMPICGGSRRKHRKRAEPAAARKHDEWHPIPVGVVSPRTGRNHRRRPAGAGVHATGGATRTEQSPAGRLLPRCAERTLELWVRASRSGNADVGSWVEATFEPSLLRPRHPLPVAAFCLAQPMLGVIATDPTCVTVAGWWDRWRRRVARRRRDVGGRLTYLYIR